MSKYLRKQNARYTAQLTIVLQLEISSPDERELDLRIQDALEALVDKMPNGTLFRRRQVGTPRIAGDPAVHVVSATASQVSERPHPTVTVEP